MQSSGVRWLLDVNKLYWPPPIDGGRSVAQHMNTFEVFNQQRIDRCLRIQRLIMDNWRKTNSFQYVVRVTDSVEGASLSELRKKYFTVGVPGTTEDIPFIDLLVIFSLIEQEHAVMKDPQYRNQKKFSVNYKVTTDWPDDEAVRLLAGIQIQTHNRDKFLRIAATRKLNDSSTDDQKPES
jgi:hypothetical protein